MNIHKEQEQNRLTIKLEGRLDTVTAPLLEAEILAMDGQTSELILDFSELKYLSSSGLRVIVSAHKWLAGRGRLIIRNVQKSVMEVFDITGFTEVLTLE